MILLHVAGWALLVTSAPAWALDHDLIGMTRSAATVTAAPQTVFADAMLIDKASDSQRQYPELREGDRWICAVGQPRDISAQCRERARQLGWGYWRFPAHAKCPAGIYVCVVRQGRLKPSGDWMDCHLPTPVSGSRADRRPVRAGE